MAFRCECGWTIFYVWGVVLCPECCRLMCRDCYGPETAAMCKKCRQEEADKCAEREAVP
jgi:hypothetical protein